MRTNTALLLWALIVGQAQAHPAAGELDPYAGFARLDGASCCGGRDCHPAPYDGHSGLVGLPDGTWIDPWAAEVARYSSFDDHAHVCITRGKLQCIFIPGAAASMVYPGLER